MHALIGGSPAALLLSLVCGVIVGAIFAVFRLPIPAPSALQAIIGIFGLWLGLVLVTVIRGV